MLLVLVIMQKRSCYLERLKKKKKRETLLIYFDTKKKIFVVADPHATGLGAILLQGDDFESAKPRSH